MPREEIDDRTFLEKYGMAVLGGIIVLIGVALGLGFYFFKGKVPPPHKPEEIMVHLLPPPPLPPPPPPPPPPKVPPPPKEQKMVELKPKDQQPPKPTPSPAPSAPGPKASGPPSDDGTAGGSGGSGNGDIGGEGGTAFGFYAGQVGDQIRNVLSSNATTSKASFKAKAHIYIDSTGRITRVTLSHSDDDPSVDAVIKGDALVGQMVGAPPQGLPMPIVMMLDGKRPN
jgi:protein TonB